jgi:general stress protein 26
MNRTFRYPVSRPGNLSLLFLLSLIPICTASLAAQEPMKSVDRDSLIAAAREIMSLQTYCGLVTVDSTGQPHARTMNPFPPEEDMTVWMATSTDSRKAREIGRNPRVCLYYANHETAIGNVNIVGKAFLVQDPAEIQKRERGYWQQAFPDRSKLVLIKVVPEKIEVLNYKRGFHNDPRTFGVPIVEFPKN